ncbi:hypothetical protein MAPG_10266 [Magnaporthiopsis poae ATCC 64411]|uniref:Uncharacterized protein n=1 Tax=Magnaporthiopsis poae (strain ATCC 64411 / 73-15) TaxID=644358 RepID=A0A0C4EC52_MAGP6|nr:hypothetical protein MAPG_10266 [Magnaporthiopsis poae ATCC 64411]
MSVSRGLAIEAMLMGHISCNNANGDSLLHWAIRKRGASLARPLILSGVPANLPNDEGQTPLHLAVAANDLETCKLLVASTASSSLLHLRDKEGLSPLDLATIKLSNGSFTDDSILDCLFQRGAWASQHEAQWFWTFCSAICSGNSVLLDLFLRHGKNFLDKCPIKGGTTLHVAVQIVTARDMALAPIRLLLEAGVDVNAVDNDGATALHIAAQKSNTNVVRYLVRHGAKVDAVDAELGGTPLADSVFGANVENARDLIEAGANAFHKLNKGRPLLHLAAQEGQREILGLLLSAGVQVNTLDELGETAAYWACRNGHLDCLKFMISQGLDPKAGKSDLMEEAIKRGHLPIVESLWDHGVPITLQYLSHLRRSEDIHRSRWDILYFLLRHLDGDADVKSDNDAHAHDPERYLSFGFPILAAAHLEAGHKVGRLDDESCALLLFTCALYGFLSGTRALLDAASTRGGEVQKYYVQPHGWRALEIAACEDDIVLVQLFLKHGWDPNREDLRGRTSLHLAAICGAADVVKELLGECNIHHRDKDRNTPLHMAAHSGSVPVLELLVDAGGDVGKQNKNRETPLGIACEQGHAVAVQWLLEHGSLGHIGDVSSHLSPLHHAARGNHVHCMEHLIAAGFDVNAKRAGGNTPLHAAATSGSWKAVSRLLEADADPSCLNDQGKTPSTLAFSHADLPPDVITGLLKKTAVDWDLPLSQSIFFNACVGGNRGAISAVLGRLHQDCPQEAKKAVRRLLPELLGELCSSDPAANNSTAFSFLIPYLHSSSKEALSTTILSATIVAGDDAELAQSLVDINPKNADLHTPRLWTMLHFACRYGRIKIARVLLANGAPARAESEDGVTALGMAKKYLEGDILEKFVDLFRFYEAALNVLKENKELQDLILAVQSEQ